MADCIKEIRSFGAFKMNIHKAMEKQFRFLLEYGYVLKKYRNGGDLDLWYTNTKSEILISYYYGIDSAYKKHYDLQVIITKDKLHNNLLRSYRIFNENDLSVLEQSLAGKNTAVQLDLYAAFIQRHIDQLT